MQLAGHPLQEGVTALVEKGSRSGTPSNHGHGCGIHVGLGRFVSCSGVALEGTQKGWPQAQPCPHPIVPFGTNVCTHRGSASLKPGLKTLFRTQSILNFWGLTIFGKKIKKSGLCFL